MTLYGFVVFQFVVGAIGFCICLLTWHDAWRDYVLLRKLGMNGTQEILTKGDLFEETLRVAMQSISFFATCYLWSIGYLYYTWTGRLTLASVAVLITLGSLNRWYTRRQVYSIRVAPMKQKAGESLVVDQADGQRARDEAEP